MFQYNFFKSILTARCIIVIIVIITFTSCVKNILDVKPLNSVSDADVWNDMALTQAYVTNVYRTVPHGFTINGAESFANFSDEARHRIRPDYDLINAGGITPTAMSHLDLWIGTSDFPSYYTTISKCNRFFQNIDNSTLASDIKNRLIGEMKVLRAYSYHRLISIYGGVPLITKVFDLNDDFDLPRNTYEECMAFIEKELTEAADLLPLSYDNANRGRITKGTALAVLSRALLYAASPLNNQTNELVKWQKASDAALKVINLNNGMYKLFSDYKTLFLAANSYNPEIIWARLFNTSFNASLGREAYVELVLYPNGSGGFARINPLHNLIDDYETLNGLQPEDDPGYNLQNPYIKRDPRFYASILYDGAPFKGRFIETFIPKGADSNEGTISPHNASTTGYYQRKFMDETINNPSGDIAGNTPWPYFRLAEIYLNYAEAEYYLGNESACREYLNKIRKRPSVNMPDITQSGTALLERLRNERKIELAFESHRWFDVRRWQIAHVTNNFAANRIRIVKDAAGNKTFSIVKIEDRKFTNPTHYLMPIPQSEINKSSKLVQNSGY